jgi:hypothetical protein
MGAAMERREINWQNARKSTGPRDTTSTRYNARKHGLLSEGVTELDSPETFRDFCAKLEAELRPVGEVERFLTRRIALGMVRLKRAVFLEADFLTAQLNPPVTKTEGGWQDKFEELNGKTVVVDPGLPARLAAEAMDALANSFGRYETQAECEQLLAHVGAPALRSGRPRRPPLCLTFGSFLCYRQASLSSREFPYRLDSSSGERAETMNLRAAQTRQPILTGPCFDLPSVLKGTTIH